MQISEIRQEMQTLSTCVSSVANRPKPKPPTPPTTNTNDADQQQQQPQAETKDSFDQQEDKMDVE